MYTVIHEESESEVENLDFFHPDLETREKQKIIISLKTEKIHKHKLFGRPAGGSGPKFVRMKL